jgi:hypothetical protein
MNHNSNNNNNNNNNNTIYFVDEIRGECQRSRRGKQLIWYLVKWQNEPDEKCTWERIENILDPELINEYKHKQHYWKWHWEYQNVTTDKCINNAYACGKNINCNWIRYLNHTCKEIEEWFNRSKSKCAKEFSIRNIGTCTIDFTTMTQKCKTTGHIIHIRRICSKPIANAKSAAAATHVQKFTTNDCIAIGKDNNTVASSGNSNSDSSSYSDSNSNSNYNSNNNMNTHLHKYKEKQWIDVKQWLELVNMYFNIKSK